MFMHCVYTKEEEIVGGHLEYCKLQSVLHLLWNNEHFELNQLLLIFAAGKTHFYF